MAYDEKLAARVRKVLSRRRGVGERKMFGGLCFLLRGHMCCGISDDRLMLRLGADLAAAALDGKHVQPMDFTGTALKTMVFVDPPGCRGEKALKQWFDQAAGFVATLPPKGRGKGK